MASIETNLNQSPFFDDFNEDKNFHRVLFRPGYAVQARELTQLQSILQNQVERFGDEILDNGTILNGCDIELQKWNYVKLRDKNANNTILSLSQFFTDGKVANCVIEGQTTGINARVLDVVDGSEGNAPDYLTAFVSYLDSGTNSTTKTFADNEVLIFRNAVGNQFIAAANTIFANSTGLGLGASSTDGVVYHKGHFIRSERQSGAVSKYTTSPTIRVGFETVETIVDSNQDSSLLDNASGATNFTAPGSSRLKISTKIRSRSLSDANTSGFFPVMDVQNGRVIRVKTTGYGDLDDEMAKRTYEESGDYALKPFVVRVEEHLRTDNNNGVYSASQSGDRDKLVVEVEPSVGYVRGYRTELTDLVRVDIDKAKDIDIKNDVVVGQAFGNYVICNEVSGTWDFQGIRQVDLYESVQQSITDNKFAGNAAAVGSKVGTANIRGFQYHSGRSGSPTGQFRLYLFNIDMNSGKTFSQVKSVIQENANSKKSRADVVQEGGVSKLQDTSLTSLIFPLQNAGVKTLKDGSGSVQTQYVYRAETTGQFNTSGDATITANTAHAGTTQGNDDTGNSPNLSSTDAVNLIVVAQQDVTTNDKTGLVAQSGTTITQHGGTATAFTSEYSVGDYIIVGSNPPQRITAISSATSMSVFNSNTYTGGLAHAKFMPAGYIFNSADLTFVSTSSQHQIQLNEGDLTGGFNASVYFDVLRSQCQPDKKVIRKDRYVHINTGSHSESKGGPWSLGVPDGAEIKAVYMGSNTGVTTADALVTTEFRIDDGQRDSMYDIARLVKNPTSNLDLTNKGLLVKFNYFDRDRTAGIGFLTVDSYPIDDSNPDAADKISTAEIQRYTASNGRFFDLRDSVDFRPIRNSTATPSTTGTAAAAPTNPGVTANFNVLAAGAHLPTPDKNFQADVQRYLPRMDIVSIRQNGGIVVKKGASSETPSLPMQDDNSMTLAGIYIPPYPSLSPEAATFYERPSYEVLVNPRDNRRFTMADLRQLESTVEENANLISLNKFEIDALKTSVLRPDDPIDSAEPPKNSITIDPRPAQDASNTLRSSDLSFVRNPMRAIPTLQDIELELNTNSGVRVGNNKVTMVPSGYGELVNQVFATGSRTVSVKTETPAKTWNGQMHLAHPVCAVQQIAEPISVVSSAPATSSSSPSYGGGYGYNWSGAFTIGGGWLSFGGGLGF
jgi:hypothetical protein